MASFSERIRIVVDVVSDGAKSGFASLKSDIAEADGVGGKFKAGMTNVFDTVKANAGAMALGAGTALFAFGVKAVGAYTDTAKAALDLSTATGLSVEDASRWIAISDDLGISAESIQKSFGAIVKSLDKTKWDEYGIATHDAGGKLLGTNEIMLSAFDVLAKIPEGTARAKAGTDLFSKSYADLSPLIGKSRAEMEKYLGAVEQGQVITKTEADKAEKMRLAQDQLGDAVKEVTLQIGSQVAGLAPLIVKVAEFIALWGKLGNVIGDQSSGWSEEAATAFSTLGGSMDTATAIINASGKSYDEWVGIVASGKMTVEEATAAIYAAAAAHGGYIDAQNPAALAETARQIDKITGSAYNEADATAEAAKEVDVLKARAKLMSDDFKRGLDEMSGRWDALTGNINNDKTWANLQTGFDDLKVKVADAWTAAADGAVDSEQKTRDARVAIDDMKLGVIDYAREVLKVPIEKTTMIVAAIDNGELDRAEALLANLTRNRNANVFIQAHGGAGYFTGPVGAEGGLVKARPGGTLVNVAEVGKDELLIPLDKVPGLTTGSSGGGDTITIIQNLPPGLDPQAVAKATRSYYRRGGR